MSSRADRIAENEAAFRGLNERISEWPEHQRPLAGQRIRFVCECGDDRCFERVYLTRSEYEAVRADARDFAVVPGHEMEEAETVLERHAGYFVVRKHEAVRGIVENTDPRGR